MKEYFGKKGISLLGFMVLVLNSEKMKMEVKFIDVIFRNWKQGMFQIISALEVVIPFVKHMVPASNNLILNSDNATVFTGGNMSLAITLLNQIPGIGMRITEFINNEAQWSSGMHDTHFSFLNIAFKNCVRKDDAHKMESPEEIYAACAAGKTMHTAGLFIEIDEKIAKQFKSETSFKPRYSKCRGTHHITFDEHTSIFNWGVVPPTEQGKTLWNYDPIVRMYTNTG